MAERKFNRNDTAYYLEELEDIGEVRIRKVWVSGVWTGEDEWSCRTLYCIKWSECAPYGHNVYRRDFIEEDLLYKTRFDAEIAQAEYYDNARKVIERKLKEYRNKGNINN